MQNKTIIYLILTKQKTQNNCFLIHQIFITYQNETQNSFKSQIPKI